MCPIRLSPECCFPWDASECQALVQDLASTAPVAARFADPELCSWTTRGTLVLRVERLDRMRLTFTLFYPKPPLLESTIGDHFAQIVSAYGDRTASVSSSISKSSCSDIETNAGSVSSANIKMTE